MNFFDWFFVLLFAGFLLLTGLVLYDLRNVELQIPPCSEGWWICEEN